MSGRSKLTSEVLGPISKSHHDEQTLDIRDLETRVNTVSQGFQRKVTVITENHHISTIDFGSLLYYKGLADSIVDFNPSQLGYGFEVTIRNASPHQIRVIPSTGFLEGPEFIILRPNYSLVIVSDGNNAYIGSLSQEGLSSIAKIIKQWTDSGNLALLTQPIGRVNPSDEITEETLNRTSQALENKMAKLALLLETILDYSV